ncbi:MAG: hypothetical protein KDM63_22520, partial [Verrucomicrobiae bacterium]|nr:hypothetical protein [Verrucomicrobiae bacterium]
MDRSGAAGLFLEELRHFDQTLDGYTEAANRPHQSPDLTPVQHLSDLIAGNLNATEVINVSRVLILRAHAQFKINQPELSLDDIVSVLRFSNNLGHQGSGFTVSVSAAPIAWVRSPIWFGLKDQVWNRQQLDLVANELELSQ